MHGLKYVEDSSCRKPVEQRRHLRIRMRMRKRSHHLQWHIPSFRIHTHSPSIHVTCAMLFETNSATTNPPVEGAAKNLREITQYRICIVTPDASFIRIQSNNKRGVYSNHTQHTIHNNKKISKYSHALAALSAACTALTSPALTLSNSQAPKHCALEKR